MHVPNHMISEQVGIVSMAVSFGWFAMIWSKIREALKENDSSSHRIVIGAFTAFVFAAQMVNFRLPVLNGVSGHFVGASLCAIAFGPYLASVMMAGVIAVQCVFFNDGGLLALGCNVLNMALVPAFLTDLIVRQSGRGGKGVIGTLSQGFVCGCVAVLSGAVLVSIQVGLSGGVVDPAKFSLTMLGVHAVIGFAEGLITAVCAVGFLKAIDGGQYVLRMTIHKAIITLVIATMISCCVLGAFASESPDGLEWSYVQCAYRSEGNCVMSSLAVVIDKIQEALTPFPDYCFRFMQGWFASAMCGITGCAAAGIVFILTAGAFRDQSAKRMHQ